MVNVLDDIISRGGDPSNIIVVCVVACPPALKKLSEKFVGKFSYCCCSSGQQGVMEIQILVTMLSVTPCVLLISHACVFVLLLHTTVQTIAC